MIYRVSYKNLQGKTIVKEMAEDPERENCGFVEGSYFAYIGHLHDESAPNDLDRHIGHNNWQTVSITRDGDVVLIENEEAVECST